jgi:hypothetical protein
VCLGYKSTTDVLPYAQGAPAQASFALATCRKRDRWTLEWFAHAWYELGPGRYDWQANVRKNPCPVPGIFRRHSSRGVLGIGPTTPKCGSRAIAIE